MNSIMLQDKRITLLVEMRTLIDKAKEEVRDLTEEEKNDYEGKKTQVEEINKQLEELQKRYKTDITSNMNEENKKEVRYNLIKTINRVANNLPLEGLESEINLIAKRELQKAGISQISGQIYIPSTETRNLTVKTEGEDVVVKDILTLREAVEEHSILGKIANVMDNLVGDVSIPQLSSLVDSATFEGETDAVGKTTPTISSTLFKPKRISIQVPVSLQFLQQDSVSANEVLMRAIKQALVLKAEKTFFGTQDDNSGKAIEGIFQAKNVTTTLSTFKTITDFEAQLDKYSGMGYVYCLSPKAKSILRTLTKSDKGVSMVMNGSDIDGVEALTSGFIPDKHVALVVPGSVTYLLWGGISLTVDPYTKAGEGLVVITANAYCNVGVNDSNAVKVAKFA